MVKTFIQIANTDSQRPILKQFAYIKFLTHRYFQLIHNSVSEQDILQAAQN